MTKLQSQGRSTPSQSEGKTNTAGLKAGAGQQKGLARRDGQGRSPPGGLNGSDQTRRPAQEANGKARSLRLTPKQRLEAQLRRRKLLERAETCCAKGKDACPIHSTTRAWSLPRTAPGLGA